MNPTIIDPPVLPCVKRVGAVRYLIAARFARTDEGHIDQDDEG